MENKRSKIILLLWTIVGVLFLLLCWGLVSFFLQKNGNHILPYPSDTIARSFLLLFGAKAGTTWLNIAWSFVRLAIGYIVSFFFAALLGTLAGLYTRVKAFLRPSVFLAKVIPTAAVVMILIGIWYGPAHVGALTFIPAILVFLVAFPILYEAFVRGLENEDPAIIDALRIDGGQRSWKAITTVRYANIKPYLALALAQSLGLSMKVSVMSEILTANSSSHPGVGGLISLSRMDGDVEDIVAYALIVLFLMILIDIPYFLLSRKKKRSTD